MSESCRDLSFWTTNHVTGLTPGHVFQREPAKTETNRGKCGVRGINPGHVICGGGHRRFGVIRAQLHA